MFFLFSCAILNYDIGRLAQLVERLPYKQDVTGSSPVLPICTVERRNNCPWRRILCPRERLFVRSEEFFVTIRQPTISQW